MSRRAKVAIIMGSDSDVSTMNEAVKVLAEYGVTCDVRILSAHRSPEDTAKFAKSARSNGFSVIIAGAGGAAHLAGVVASYTTLPVIGVPMETKELKGIDSFLSTIQMPSGVPVATVAIGKAGAKNAGILALQILGITDKVIAKKLENLKRSLVESVRNKNRSRKSG
ncbi:MAG: 5-(carboxyamino)imidazole ribonucleotide mutase [Candidatus Omnitrophota bacterium]|nr:5-(carboxyamino)imidazole ribonucleotide mutase [Candidatus Omnitrophota bacterium]